MSRRSFGLRALSRCAMVTTLLAAAVFAGGCGSPGGTFVALNDAPDLESHFAGEKPVVVSFYLPMCPACGMASFTLTRLSNEYADRVDFVKLNGYDASQACMDYDVSVFPTVVLFQKGRPTHRWINEQNISTYRDVLDPVLANPLK